MNPGETMDPVTAAAQDFRAAVREFRSNVEVRRLMFVVANVLVPALVMAAADAMSGADYPPELAFVPRRILSLTGGIAALSGLLIGLVLARCHMGMVIQGNKLAKVLHGRLELAPVNLLGVTPNFLLLTGISAAGGLCLACIAWGLAWWLSALLGAALLVVLMAMLLRDHRRALATARRLDAAWTHAPIAIELREQHATDSLEDTTADIAVVVTMAAALFAGAFNALTNVGGIADQLVLEIPPHTLKRVAVPTLAWFMVVSLLLSCRMVVRLRIALAQHSSTLAGLRQEPDDPWRFKPLERTFLLYGIVLVLACASGGIAGRSLGSGVAAWVATGALAMAGLCWYPFALRLARTTREQRRQIAQGR
ncbi:MAG: hypothetical protein KDC87_03365 [Planctomycetes bacterium]|nr:hypothetical protein [Planctomycetota bacterium]MCB9868848.1 hypothetical protein [Planctomycetota bacterium]MCB9889562.1 hypothetical protein [Planctomycetota bacterium]